MSIHTHRFAIPLRGLILLDKLVSNLFGAKFIDSSCQESGDFLRSLSAIFLVALAFSLGRTDANAGPVSVLTQHNDNARTGANLGETQLTTANVNAKTFGKLFSREVEGDIYTQPLYVPKLRMADNRTHNVVYVATQANLVYAFDADDPNQAVPLWRVKLGEPIHLPVIECDDPAAEPLECDFANGYGPYLDIQKQIGITSSPVIDAETNTLYAIALTHPDRQTFRHELHALDLRTGEEKFGSPRVIEATVEGLGSGHTNGLIAFESRRHIQRVSLLLDRGLLYFAFAAYADTRPYHGWIMAYDAHTLDPKGVFNVTPDTADGGVWQSGAGLAADQSGDIYAVAGNGPFDAFESGAGRSYADSALKIRYSPGKGLTLVDFFTPYNHEIMPDLDMDLGSTGIMLLPWSRHAVFGSKEGKLYVTNQDDLGKLNSAVNGARVTDDSQITQVLDATDFSQDNHNIQGTPVAWDSSAGKFMYVWGVQSKLRAYRFDDEHSQFFPRPSSESPARAPDGAPGGFLSISANGNKVGSGILWASHPHALDATGETVPGTIEAYDASDVSKLLWSSRQHEARDGSGNFAKFVAPTIAGGKVYVATFSDQLIVYGFLPKGAR